MSCARRHSDLYKCRASGLDCTSHLRFTKCWLSHVGRPCRYNEASTATRIIFDKITCLDFFWNYFQRDGMHCIRELALRVHHTLCARAVSHLRSQYSHPNGALRVQGVPSPIQTSLNCPRYRSTVQHPAAVRESNRRAFPNMRVSTQLYIRSRFSKSDSSESVCFPPV
jgi:hypothetical protein